VSGQLQDPAALPAGKEPPRTLLDVKLGGPNTSGQRGEDKNHFSCRESNPGQVRSSVTI